MSREVRSWRRGGTSPSKAVWRKTSVLDTFSHDKEPFGPFVLRKKMREEQARDPFGSFGTHFACAKVRKTIMHWNGDFPMTTLPAVFFAWRRLLDTRQSVPRRHSCHSETMTRRRRRKTCAVSTCAWPRPFLEGLQSSGQEEKKQRLAAVARV